MYHNRHYMAGFHCCCNYVLVLLLFFLFPYSYEPFVTNWCRVPFMCWSVAGSLVCLGYTASVCVHTEPMLCVMQGMYCTDFLELHYDCSTFSVSLLFSLSLLLSCLYRLVWSQTWVPSEQSWAQREESLRCVSILSLKWSCNDINTFTYIVHVLSCM